MIDSDLIFIHYSAQCWAHKNHYNLICAFRLIADKYPSLKLILTGSDNVNTAYIINTIKENNLEDRIINLGFVPLEELKWLYKHSRGLIMPTLLGPTNMPPLEALALGCPVAVSNMPGHREQLGNNAIYFNPLDIEEIKNAIENIINHKFERSISPFPSIQTNMVLLNKYFGELKTIRQTWA
jgi:glycosyltransferase involved in cell wall biosynthesis